MFESAKQWLRIILFQDKIPEDGFITKYTASIAVISIIVTTVALFHNNYSTIKYYPGFMYPIVAFQFAAQSVLVLFFMLLPVLALLAIFGVNKLLNHEIRLSRVAKYGLFATFPFVLYGIIELLVQKPGNPDVYVLLILGLVSFLMSILLVLALEKYSLTKFLIAVGICILGVAVIYGLFYFLFPQLVWHLMKVGYLKAG